MPTLRQLAALGAVLASIVAASSEADALEYGEFGRSLRNRNVFDKLMKRQIDYCPLGTYCDNGMSCCGMYCCYSWGSCMGTSEILKYCSIDFSSTDNSTSTDSFTDTDSTGTTAGGEAESPSPSPDDSSSTDSSTDTSAGSSTSSSTTSSSTSSTNKSGFAGWSTGAKAGLIIGVIAGVAILASLIWWIAFMTCCRNRHKPQKVSDLRPPAALVAPHPPAQVQSPPPIYQTPAPPPIPNAPELGGAEDAYGAYKASTSPVQDPATAPKFDPQTGSYHTANHGQVHEAPENQRY